MKTKIPTYILVLNLMLQRFKNPIKEKCASSIKCNPQSQQKNLHNLQKMRMGLMRVTIVMGNQNFSVIWKILNILKILTSQSTVFCTP